MSRRLTGAAAVLAGTVLADTVLACTVLACAGLIAGCGSQSAGVTGAGPPPLTAPLTTSLVTAQGTWAVAVMGGADAGNKFWQLFFRPATSGRWSLATPQGVASNGGLVAAGGGAYLVVGFRPSQNLAFSPLATSTDTGRNWTPGLLDAGLADTPGAIAVGPSGRTLALLRDGTIEAAPTAGDAAAGRWAPLTTESPGGVRPGSRLRAGGRDRGLVRPRSEPDGGGELCAAGCGRGLHRRRRDLAAGGAGPARREPGAGARTDRRRGRHHGAAGRWDQPVRGVAGRDALDGVGPGDSGRRAGARVRARRVL